MFNNEINKTRLIVDMIDRFIVRGRNSDYDIDVLICGTVNDYVWIKKYDLILSKRCLDFTSPHVACMTICPKKRNINGDSKNDKDRYIVCVRWNFIKEDIKEMREIVEKATIKKFNVISVVFLIELIVVAISAYPLFSIKGNIGIIIWLCLFAITLYTASKIEKFKKSHDIQTYKEILAFIDGKQLTHDETQQEIGKRNYQKIIFAFIAGVIALIICFVVIFICQHLTN